MGLISPGRPDLDLDAWAAQPEGERVRQMCVSWATQGFGAPAVAYLFYALKIALYVGGWIALCAVSPDIDGLSDIGDWWSDPVALQKAIVWTLLFELLGLGCGSGPLTGRYVPPVVAFTHMLRPGTVRLPPFPRHVPLTAGDRRGVLDAGLYGVVVVASLRALLAPDDLLGAGLLAPIVVALVVLSLRDKTAFLMARGEHHWTMLVVMIVAGDDVTVMFAGLMVVQLAIWWGAATSKLNHHFPSVVAIMVSNSPLIRLPAMKRAMYRGYPDDLRPSRLAAALAHGGTAFEYLFPLALVLGGGGPVTVAALAAGFVFHAFIVSCVPMGVPIEWNIVFVYGMFVLFGVHGDISPLEVLGSPLLAVILVALLLAGPVHGNLRPDRVSFLPSMRYYAGNWASSLWLFRRGADAALDEHITKTARTVSRQLEGLYDEDVIRAVLGKLRAFRSMHLHGRALNALLPAAVEDLEAYDINEGEGIAGVVLGWNFGDGHLHHEQLLAAVQSRCGFAPGDLRCVFLESQPLGQPWMRWRIVDAATGLVDEGRIRVEDLLPHQPWPEDRAIDIHA